MSDKIMNLSENNRRRLIVALAFSLLIIILSGTGLGYIPMGKHLVLDLSIVPALFAALIGGYRVGVPVAFIWGVISFYHPDSGVHFYTLILVIINKLILVICATAAYSLALKIHKGSTMNPYRAIIMAIISKSIFTNFLFLNIREKGVSLVMSEKWWNFAIGKLAIELSISLVAMYMLIEQLKKYNIIEFNKYEK